MTTTERIHEQVQLVGSTRIIEGLPSQLTDSALCQSRVSRAGRDGSVQGRKGGKIDGV